MNYYSKSESRFLNDAVFVGELPSDVVMLTDEDHALLLSGQAAGKQIVADGDGYPILVEPPPVSPGAPAVVTRAQGKAALISADLWPQVLAYVDGIADPTQQALARVALDDTTEWRRDSPTLAAAAAALGLSDEDLDGLFITASAIIL